MADASSRENRRLLGYLVLAVLLTAGATALGLGVGKLAERWVEPGTARSLGFGTIVGLLMAFHFGRATKKKSHALLVGVIIFLASVGVSALLGSRIS